MIFLTLFIVPLLIAVFSFIQGGHRVTWKEFGLHVGIQSLVTAVTVFSLYHVNTRDLEILNGKISKKEKERVSCSHSYPCRCRSVSCGKGCRTTVCSTCYSHLYDVDWAVYTTLKDRIEISRVDRQGLRMPQRWDQAVIGEPASVVRSFENFIKASPDSLFRHQGLVEKFASLIPPYPGKLYDYYRVDRVVSVGLTIPDIERWNEILSGLNSDLNEALDLAPNVVLVLAQKQPNDYFYALEQAWVGGKENDVVLVVSVDETLGIQWAEVMAWTKDEFFKVRLRDDIASLGRFELEKVVGVLKEDISKYYVRKPMKDFEYLKSRIVPTPLQWLVAMLVGTTVSIGLAIWTWHHDIFNEERHYRNRFY